MAAQNFADKEYYLIDSLVLDELSEGDRSLLESSLKKYHSAKDDTSRINSMDEICENMMHPIWEEYQYLQYEEIKASLIKHDAGKISLRLQQSFSGAVNNLGYINLNKGNVDIALGYYQKSLELSLEQRDKNGTAVSYNNIGFIYTNLGNISKGLEYFHKALKIYEELGDKKGVAGLLGNIGYIYEGQNEFELALKYHHKSLKIDEEIENKQGIALSLQNIGGVYFNQKKPQLALDAFKRAMEIHEERNDIKSVAACYTQLGIAYEQLQQLDTALICYQKSLSLRKEGSDKLEAATAIANISKLYLKQDKMLLAQEFGEKAFRMFKEIGVPEEISETSWILSNIYESQGKGMQALEMYKLYVQMKDSINNEETQKASIRQQTQYEFEKAQIVKENEAKEHARLEAEATGRRNNLQYSLIFLGILLLFGIILSLGFIKVSPNVAEGLIFFTFLILFEFALVFVDPYLNNYTNGEPVYNLAANALIALLIFPLHAILEKLLKKRIIN